MILRVATFEELDATTLYALLRLRTDVFVVEQQCPYPELDGRDLEAGTRHLWLAPKGEPDNPLAYLRILQDQHPTTARIGRVCTAAHARGTGLAAKLLTAALGLIGKDQDCVLNAQSHLVKFYAGLGFAPSGQEYVEDGIPHIPMRLR